MKYENLNIFLNQKNITTIENVIIESLCFQSKFHPTFYFKAPFPFRDNTDFKYVIDNHIDLQTFEKSFYVSKINLQIVYLENNKKIVSPILTSWPERTFSKNTKSVLKQIMDGDMEWETLA